jgi:hypothetical protein
MCPRFLHRQNWVEDSPKPLSIRRDKDDGGEIVDGKAVVSGRDSLPVLEPSEHPLDDVSAPACDAVERIDDGTGGSTRDDGFDASVLEPITQPISIIDFVSDQPFSALWPCPETS